MRSATVLLLRSGRDRAPQIAHRRGKKVAIVALARKLAGVLFAIWRDGTLYSPTKSEPEVAEAAE